MDLDYQGQAISFYVTKSGYLAGNAIIFILPGEYPITSLIVEDSESINETNIFL